MSGIHIGCVLSLTLLMAADTPAASTPEVLAGTGKSGYVGEGRHVSEIQLNVPSDIHVTESGELYIADTSNHRIRKVGVDGMTNTVVGNGQRVFTNDGLPASKTGLMNVSSIAVDGRGAIYYAEWSGQRVRKVDPAGVVTTIAGNGETGYVGEGLAATETSLWTPSRIFLDGKGNLFIAEWHGHRVRKVDPYGTITTIAGNGEGKFSGDGGPATEASLKRPNGLFVSPTGEVYISDLGNHRVRLVGSDGTITTIAGDGKSEYKGDGGAATDASLNAPAGLFLDDGGNLFISDSRNQRIRKVDPQGTISTVVDVVPTPDAEGKLSAMKLRSPTSVFVDAYGGLYVCDASQHRVMYVREAAVPTRLAVTAPGVVGYDTRDGFLDRIVDAFRKLLW